MHIVDTQGRPIMDEIASIKRDINRVFYGRTLRNEDDTLLARGGGKGLKIYDELKRDAHAGAVLAKRKLAVTSRPWVVDPASERRADKKAAELVKGALEHLRFSHVRKRLLEATLKGFAVSEVLWELRDGMVLPANILARDQRRFKFDLDGHLHLLTPNDMLDGEPMPPRKFIVHRRGADDDSPYGTGVGGMLFWPVFFKRNTITFWLTFADKFGSPTMLGKYPSGTDEKDQRKLMDALESIAQDAAVKVPEGMVIELLEATRGGSIDTYEKLVRYMDEQMSKAVLGETMSTTAASTGLGSNQAGVQNEVRLEVAQDDATELDETLSDTLVRWIVEFNMPGAGLPKLRTDFAVPEDLVKRAERDSKLHAMGWEPTEDYILDTYGDGFVKKQPAEPEPELDLVEVPGTQAETPEAGDEAEFAEGKPLQKARRQQARQQQALVDGSVALSRQWRTVLGQRVEDLLSVAEETGDFSEFKARLDKLLNAEPDRAAVDAIAKATFAGHVMGRGQAQPAKRPQGMLQRLLGRLPGMRR